VNAFPVTDPESMRRRDDVLRELNLYPLWQLRVPVMKVEAAAEAAKNAAMATEPISEQVVTPKPAHTDYSRAAQTDCSNMGWAELRNSVQACTACTLRAGCTQTVFGMGDEKADWLFVGSWPTEDDDAQGLPFAGQAGQLLDNMLAAIKLKRGANVYLSNVVKCTGSIRRGPQAEQIAQCSPYLNRQIQLLQPKLIIALGHAAATALLGEDREWNSLLGKVHEYRGTAQDYAQAAIPLVVTHHPAALLLSPLNKAQTWRDLCLASDTMRGLAS
jgi:DNA polymerase